MAGRHETAAAIVAAILADLAGRRGLDIEEIIDDEDIYESLQEDLFEIVDDILFQYDSEWSC